MNRWLLGALVISVAVNLWFIATRPLTSPPAPLRAPEARIPAAPPFGAIDARIAALEDELAAAHARADEVEAAFDPVALVVALRRPAIEKARLIAAIESETDRMTAARKLGIAMGAFETSGAELLAALRKETDPVVLAVLAQMLRAGAAQLAGPEVRSGFVDLLRNDPDPLKRAAAVCGFWCGGPLGGEGAAEALISALRGDPSPDVVGAVAEPMGLWVPVPGAADALRAAADRLPAGGARRLVYAAIAHSSPPEGGSEELYAAFDAASAPDVKEDIAAAAARIGNSGGLLWSPDPQEPQAEAEARARATHDRLVAFYRAASELRTRQDLARAAMTGYVEACRGIGLKGLYLELADIEPDPAQRDRLLKAAGLDLEKLETADVGRILCGRE